MFPPEVVRLVVKWSTIIQIVDCSDVAFLKLVLGSTGYKENIGRLRPLYLILTL